MGCNEESNIQDGLGRCRRMDMNSWIHAEIHGIPVLPFFVYFSRIIDVSLDTVRIIFVSRGFRIIAPILGFFEVIIWLLAVSQVVTHVTSPAMVFAYGAGYATGNYVGMRIESRLRLGLVMLRIITQKDASKIVNFLRLEQYPVTKVEADGKYGMVHVIFIVVKRKSLPKIINTLKTFHPHAYFSVEDVREVHEGVFPGDESMKVGHPVMR